MIRPFSPSLAEMTQKTIDILSQDPDGFFLMVEGGQIDWESHANDATDTITDTVGFDEAVAVALAYASTISNTLVIVTADHETGGMSVSLGTGQQGPFFMPDATPFYVNWTSDEHTAADVPVTAQGPWSELLIGSYENTHVHDVMCIALESARGDVTGHLFQDTNGNGGQDAGEPDLIDVTVVITSSLGATQTVTTDNNGDYLITVPMGNTTLDVDDSTLPAGYVLTTANDPQTVTVTACHITGSDDVGYQPQNASIGDRVWYDADRDSLQDISETGLFSVTVFLDLDSDGTRDSGEPFDTTDTNGAYDITGLAMGIYTVTVQSDTIPADYNLTTANNPLVVTLAESEDYNEADFGFSPPPHLSITKTAIPVGGPVEPGDWITYTITVVNNGGLAGNVVISDSLDLSKVALVTSQTTTGTLTDSNPVQVTGFDLNTGQGATLTLGVTVTITSATTITNVATVESDQTTLKSSNSVNHSVQEAGSGSSTNSVYLPIVFKE
jgi:uncharacterized repeat protein (TIGR01451 family)